MGWVDSSKAAGDIQGQQQQNRVLGAAALISTGDAGKQTRPSSSAAARNRRSSSFDAGGGWVPPGGQQLQQLAHRKSSSFDQHIVRSRSRFSPGLLAGDSGLAGNGAAEVQVLQFQQPLIRRSQAKHVHGIHCMTGSCLSRHFLPFA